MGNEAALKSMAKMIQVMLPYEMQYMPKQKSTQVIYEIFEVLREGNHKIDEFEGFIKYMLKGIDEHGDTGKFDRILMNIRAIINNRYPVENEGVPLIKKGDPEWRPFDRGQYKND